MATKKHSQYTDGVTANAGDIIPTARSGADVYITPAYLKTYINPMTTLGDLIKGGAAGVLSRLGIGTNGHVLTVVAGAPAWAAPAGGSTDRASVYHSADQSIPNNSATTLAFNSEYYDSNTLHDNATNNSRITIATTGRYLVIFRAVFATSATGYRAGVLLLNGGSFIDWQSYAAAPTGTSGVQNMIIREFTAGDYIEAQVIQTSGGALDLKQFTNYSPVFSIEQLG
jgi:hypothetical protein